MLFRSKGTTIELLKDTCHFDLENAETWKNYDKVPSWIQEKIKKAENFEETGFDKFVAEYEEIKKEQEGKQQDSNDSEIKDDLPF